MKLEIYQCEECGKETDPTEYPSTYCSICKKDFCGLVNYPCFSNYHRKSECQCKGASITIINPKWIVNLVSNIEK